MKRTKRIGGILSIIALMNLFSVLYKVHQERYTSLSAFEAQVGDGVLYGDPIKEGKENNRTYRIQIPAGEAVYTSNVKEWILSPTIFLTIGLTLIIIAETKEERDRTSR